MVEDTKAVSRAVKHRLYAKIDLNAIDGRTHVGKAITALKKELRDYIGEPTPGSELLIQRITYKAIKLSLYEVSCLTDLKPEESDHYLPMANSLRLDLAALGHMAGQARAPDLRDYLATNYPNKGDK